MCSSDLRYTVNQKKEDTKYNRQYDPIFVFLNYICMYSCLHVIERIELGSPTLKPLANVDI